MQRAELYGVQEAEPFSLAAKLGLREAELHGALEEELHSLEVEPLEVELHGALEEQWLWEAEPEIG